MSERSGPPAAESLRALLGGAQGALKIFPLPEVVVFPGTPAPFHVFEPRYRAMVADALAGDRLLAVATLRPGEPSSREPAPVFPVAGAGFIEADEPLADGRYNILLRGVARVRLVEELRDTGKPYREFRTEILDDLYPPGGPAALATEVSTLERFVLELARRSPADSGTRDLADAVTRMRVPARVCDAVAAALVSDTAVRIALLEEQDVARRLARVVQEVASLLLESPAPGGVPAASA
jgi:Lon protease-like protein